MVDPSMNVTRPVAAGVMLAVNVVPIWVKVVYV